MGKIVGAIFRAGLRTVMVVTVFGKFVSSSSRRKKTVRKKTVRQKPTKLHPGFFDMEDLFFSHDDGNPEDARHRQPPDV